MRSSQWLEEQGIQADLKLSLADGKAADGMDWIHYRMGDADVYFVAELSGKSYAVDAWFRLTGRVPEIWNPVDGSTRKANTFTMQDGRTHVPLEMGAYDRYFIILREKTSEMKRNWRLEWNSFKKVCPDEESP